MSVLQVELQPVRSAAGRRSTVVDTTDPMADRIVPSAAGSIAEDATAAPVADEESHRQEFSLPPVDSGKDAYLFLAACFVVEALVWGFPFSFGVFQDYYSVNEPFRGQSSIALVGSCAMGIMYLDIPLVMGLQRLYPKPALWAPIAGLLIMCLSLALSSFSTKVSHLIVTQGVFYAIGGSIAYGPCILYIDEWFVRRKGLAYGIMWSGTGLAGFALPLLLQHLLGLYGFRTTLRVWSVALFILTAPLARSIKPRLPPAAASAAKTFNLRFALSRTFLLHQLANVAEALGFFLPGVYLPSYARAALGAGPFASALTLLLVNVASVFGCVAMGALIDRLHVTTCLLASAAGAGAATFLLWGLAADLTALYAFCVLYGLFAGSYATAWTGIMLHVTASSRDMERGAADPVMVFGFLAAGRGVGNVLSGPLSEGLLKGSPWRGRAAAGYGSGYGSLIVFTGTTAVVGGASFLWRRIGWL